MIKHLTIKNYESIKSLDINTTRINVFIGEHNSGKSNILEALTWFSVNALDGKMSQEFFRFKTPADFFYDFDTNNPIEIETNQFSLAIRYAKKRNGTILNEFEGLIYQPDNDMEVINQEDWLDLNTLSKYVSFKLSLDGDIKASLVDWDTPVRTYIYKKLKSFQQSYAPFLNPPYGENIPYLLISNKEYKEIVSAIFKEKGFRLMLKPNEGDINMAKDVNEELYAYPYTSISETMQRIIFFTLAFESNKEAVLVVDEPESNTFPMYTKQLAELIALDNSNQYFLATHDPYMLGSILSKTPADDISIFITSMDNYKTTVTKIDNNKLPGLLDDGIDIYFNLDKFISE